MVARPLVRTLISLFSRVLGSWRGATRAKFVTTLLALSVIFAAGATPNAPLANLRNWVFDAYERHLPRSRSTVQALTIDIDSESIRDLGQWPWPRDKLAGLVDAAAAARVIGIYLLLAEPDRLAGSDDKTDQILAASLRRAPVVLAAAADPGGTSPPNAPIIGATPVFETGADPRVSLPHFRFIAWPEPTLAAAARGIGFITVPPEADGIMRRMPTLASVGSVLIPSFAVEVVRAASRADSIGLRTAANGEQVLDIGDRAIHTDTAGGVWPLYSDKPSSLSIPADRILKGGIDKKVFRDRIVLIGSSAPGLGDAFETPLRRLQSGVSIQAQLVDSLLAGDLLQRPGFAPVLERVMALVLTIAAMLQFGRVADKTYTLLCGGAVILLGAGSFAAFAAAGLLIDATFPAVALLGTNVILLAERTHREVLTRRQRETELANVWREAELRTEAENARESLAIALESAQMGIWDADLIRGTCRRSARYDEFLVAPVRPPHGVARSCSQA